MDLKELEEKKLVDEYGIKVSVTSLGDINKLAKQSIEKSDRICFLLSHIEKKLDRIIEVMNRKV